MAGTETFLGFPPRSVVVVTGAASGIGRQIAVDAARAGLAVSAWDVNAADIRQLGDELRANGTSVLALPVDVTVPADVEAAFAATSGGLGPVQYLVNNAGPSSFESIAFDDGIRAAVGSVRSVTQTWLRQPGSQDGSLVNITSIAGAITGGGASEWYAAAKAGIAGYTRFLAQSRPNGIRANAVAPGFTATPRTEALLESDQGRAAVERNPLRRAAATDEISPAVLFLLSPAASYINGVVLPVDGGSVIVL